MNVRLAAIRKELGLSQTEFAERLGLTSNFVWMLEKGDRNPSKKTIETICSTFNVSREWLENGSGPRFVDASVDREKAVYDAIKKARPDMPDSFPKDFAAAMAKLSEDDWMFIARMAQDMAKKARETQAAEQEKPPDTDNTIYSVTAAKNAQPTPFKVQAGRDEELFREAQELDESDKDD